MSRIDGRVAGERTNERAGHFIPKCAFVALESVSVSISKQYVGSLQEIIHRNAIQLSLETELLRHLHREAAPPIGGSAGPCHGHANRVTVIHLESNTRITVTTDGGDFSDLRTHSTQLLNHGDLLPPSILKPRPYRHRERDTSSMVKTLHPTLLPANLSANQTGRPHWAPRGKATCYYSHPYSYHPLLSTIPTRISSL